MPFLVLTFCTFLELCSSIGCFMFFILFWFSWNNHVFFLICFALSLTTIGCFICYFSLIFVATRCYIFSFEQQTLCSCYFVFCVLKQTSFLTFCFVFLAKNIQEKLWVHCFMTWGDFHNSRKVQEMYTFCIESELEISQLWLRFLFFGSLKLECWF